ncbi:MAG: fibronectin type III domain-containing protein [Chitinophagales bacterium]
MYPYLKTLYFCFLYFFLFNSLAAQAPVCGTTPLSHEMENDADFAQQMLAETEQIAKATQKLWEKRHAEQIAKDSDGLGIITIPVVVHIVHKTNDFLGQESNITDAQVQTAITHLNEAYRNKGDFDMTSGIDTEFEFCLASKNPSGAFTNGITRSAIDFLSDLDKDTQDEALKATTGWDRTKYLNIWIVNTICSSQNETCNIAGYSFLASTHGDNRDGIVCRYDYFGTSLDRDKVIVHEAAHYLNLLHTFEGGCDNTNCVLKGDFVCDTPPDATQVGFLCNVSNSCYTDDDDIHIENPFRPTALGGLGEQNDLSENYMDYNNRLCQNMFSQGQKDRMRISFELLRSSLLASDGCQSVYNVDAGITEIVSPNKFECNGLPTVRLHNFGTQTLTSAVINFQVDNGSLNTYNWTGFLLPNTAVDVVLNMNFNLSTAIHQFRAFTSLPNGTIDGNLMNNEAANEFLSLESQSVPFIDAFNNPSISNDWLVVNPDNNITWQTTNVNGCSINGNRSAYMNCRNYAGIDTDIGLTDFMYLKMDLSNYADANLNFSVSYVPYSYSIDDRLRVVISTDCGNTFHNIYDKAGSDLMTGNSPQTTAWSPFSCAFWRTENINLGDFAFNEIIIGFVGMSSHGNNIYVDNVAIDGTEFISCAKPINIDVSDVTETSARLSWLSVEPNSVYLLKYRETSAVQWQYEQVIAGNEITINSLFTDTNYTFSLQTICQNGAKSAVEILNVTTLYTPCPPIFDVVVSNVDKTTAEISWPALPNVALYGVRYTAAAIGFDETEYVAGNWIMLNSLVTNVVYEITVQVVCTGGAASQPSLPQSFMPQIVCKSPTDITLNDVTSQCASVDWFQGEDQISYKIQFREVGGSWSTVFMSNTDYLLSELNSETEYEVQVASICPNSLSSDYGYSIIFNTLPNCPIIDGSNLDVTSISETAMTVSWPQFLGAENYVLQYKKQTESNWTSVFPTTNSWLFSNLDVCTTYECRLQTHCNESSSSNCNNNITYGSIRNFTTDCGTIEPDVYCTTSAINASETWIQHLALANFTYWSGNNSGYGNFTANVIDLAQENTYSIELTQGTLDRANAVNWRVWIDFNHNLLYETEELVFANVGQNAGVVFNDEPLVTKGFIEVPANAIVGNTQMRVAVSYGTAPNPCGSFLSGEVEDYTVLIGENVQKQIENEALAFQLYPNPCNDFLHIDLAETSENQNLEIVIFDMLGRLIKKQSIENNLQTLQLGVADLASGLYFIELKNETQQFQQKFVKK